MTCARGYVSRVESPASGLLQSEDSALRCNFRAELRVLTVAQHALTPMNTLFQDLKFSLRLLTKTPGFTIAAVLVLALGIGVNTAIFSMVHELVFSPRPWPAEKQVVQLYTQDEINPKKFRMFSYPAYKDIQPGNTSFADIMAHNLTMVGVGEGENARRTFGAIVSSNYFSTLQVPLLRGRGFLAEEERPGAAVPVVIASYNYWKRAGLPADFVGSTVRINERPFTVVG